MTKQRRAAEREAESACSCPALGKKDNNKKEAKEIRRVR